ncbi:hypothetical protein ODJ79_17075 [Actinoplanes sp. KI2]|uniref:hypothetical protein n=1 Tax=Actinoplanes sp. KI2 TaxID=2983315 RepID=UPI0021D5C2C6|nr:hypothetical protein [Actinoplanes sp. KI2]MCU7725441.1 hypothetical protein [Actinoplanes sp. KI2]
MTVLEWLLESDPAIRWQVLRDLAGATDEVVATERARVAGEGWGARLLDRQDPDGQWDGGSLFPAGSSGPGPDGQPWTATEPTLMLLYLFGADPADERVRAAVARAAEGSRWDYNGEPLFYGEGEPCINGRTVSLGVYFGHDVRGIVERLLTGQLADGGWNCEAEFGSTRSSFDSTINVLEGLLAYERANGNPAEVTKARRRGEEYLLERNLFRRRSTGAPARDDYLRLSFPPRWHYDVLRGLEHFRAAGDPPDPRVTEAVEVVRSKRQPDGAWPLENTHRGKVHFALEDGDGRPSRWNTLRALRVLTWHDANGRSRVGA